jgi:hypothetical protein
MNYKILPIFACFIFLCVCANAQSQPAPQLLKQPADWSFERFSLPPSFAPAIPYKGAEELRFSPGMFIKDSTEYFTYAFVAQFDDVKNILQSDIKNYLLAYFKGLCAVTAKERKLAVDTSKIFVSIQKKKNMPVNEIIYDASLNIFGVFADGAPVKLNMEIKVLNDAKANKTYLVFITSPREKTDKVWDKLYTIQKSFSPGN